MTTLTLLSEPPLLAAEPAPDFGPNVLLFDQNSSPAEIRRACDAAYDKLERAEFSKERVAILFKPGTYEADVNVGYYTQVYGLGKLPGDVVIKGVVESNARWRNGNATLNFWRGCENLTIAPKDGSTQWAVSQAAPLRRVHVKGSLSLFDGGWSSGGFLADSKIDGDVISGSQQQWFSRNSQWQAWKGGLWNMVFVGTNRPPQGSWPGKPFTVIDRTPVVAEKPFLYVDEADAYQVFVPALRLESSGCSWENGRPEGRSLPISAFHIALPGKDDSRSLNQALASGKNLFFPPGIYSLDEPLLIQKADTVVLGMGLATLTPTRGNKLMLVSDVPGVRIANLLFDAGSISSPTLLEIGEPGSAKSLADNPIILSDVFCRVGEAIATSAETCVVVNSNDVIGDHAWIWRADHGGGAGWSANKSDYGLIVNGNNATYYGLFVEHFQKEQTIWNGENGRVYFYQCEMPYDPPSQEEWSRNGVKGYPGYKVADHVKKHDAWGLGVYCVFKKGDIYADHAVEVPSQPGVRIRNIIAVRLGGGSPDSGINSVINGQGEALAKIHAQSRVTEYPAQ